MFVYSLSIAATPFGQLLRISFVCSVLWSWTFKLLINYPVKFNFHFQHLQIHIAGFMDNHEGLGVGGEILGITTNILRVSLMEIVPLLHKEKKKRQRVSLMNIVSLVQFVRCRKYFRTWSNFTREGHFVTRHSCDGDRLIYFCSD